MPFSYSKRPYNIDELKNMNYEDILNRCSGIIINKENLINNIELFIKISSINRINNILCLDYESTLILEKLKEKNIINKDKIYLLDDNKQIDRSYIDTTKFNKLKLFIPNTYAMWNVKFKDKLYCYQYLYQNGSIENDLYNGYYDKETLVEVERIASMIKDFDNKLTDIEKVILISNYLQKYCQFEDNNIDEKELGNPKTALFNNIGVCRTFADATTLLSNNPYLKLKVRNVRSQKHVWNIIELNGKTYQIDNSRAISDGKYTDRSSLKTDKFNSEYILFGNNSLKTLHHEEMIRGLQINCPLSQEDYDRKYLNAAIEYLEDTGMVDFDYKENERKGGKK